MAKKRGPGRPKGSGKKKQKEVKQHVLPSGFWRQVGAVFLIIFGIVAFLGLLGVGGAFPIGLAGALLWLIGWAAWILPFLFVWQAVQIFLAEDNRVSPVTWFATAFFLWFSSGLAQLMLSESTNLSVSTDPLTGEGGGFLGWLIDAQIFAGAFDAPVMALILVILCLVLLLFVLAISPAQVIKGIKNLFGREKDPEEKQNKAVAKAIAKEKADEAKGPGEVVVKKRDPKPMPVAQKSPTIVDDSGWQFPKMDLLNKSSAPAEPGNIEENGQTIINTLAQFDIQVVGNVEANVGPRITQYAFKVKSGTKMKHIAGLDNEFRSALKAEQVRIEAPIPGRQEIGIEVPNSKIADVRLYNLFSDEQWINRDPDGLLFALGKDTSDRAVFADLTNSTMTSLLIAGQPGSGKSVMINSMLMSLLYSKKPSELKLIMADPKAVELGRYKDIPHLITPIITDVSQDPEKVVRALGWAVTEMDRRYKDFEATGVLNLKEYNQKVENEPPNPEDADAEVLSKKPYLVIVLDEIADLMMSAGKDAEKLIIRLLQKGRASGIHLILATQRPSKEVVPGLMKSNIPATIAFAVRDYTASGVVLGGKGAEKLLGKGDMLFQTSESPVMKRIQGALVDNDEVNKVISYIKLKNGLAEYDPDILATNVQTSGRGGVVMGSGEIKRDALFEDVAQFAIDNGSLTTNSIAVNFDVGNPRAARIMIQLEKSGIVGPKNGTKPREVLVSSLDDIE